MQTKLKPQGECTSEDGGEAQPACQAGYVGWRGATIGAAPRKVTDAAAPLG